MAKSNLHEQLSEMVSMSKEILKNLKDAGNAAGKVRAGPRTPSGGNTTVPEVSAPPGPVTNNGGTRAEILDFSKTPAYRMGMAAGAWDVAKDTVRAGFTMLPNSQLGVEKQQLRYYSGTARGNYDQGLAGVSQVKAGMGGRLTDVNSIERVSIAAAKSGISTRNSLGLGTVSGWGAQELGMSNAASAEAILETVGDVDFQNAGLALGIQTTDSRGGRLAGPELFEQMAKKAGLLGMSAEDARDAMMSGRAADVGIMANMSDETKDMFRTYVLNKIDNQDYSMEKGQTDDASKNPELSRMKETEAYDDYVETGSKDAVAGYNMMNEGLAKTTKALDKLYQSTSAVAGLFQKISGASYAWDSSRIGPQWGAAGEYIGGALNGMAQMGGLYMAARGLGGASGMIDKFGEFMTNRLVPDDLLDIPGFESQGKGGKGGGGGGGFFAGKGGKGGGKGLMSRLFGGGKGKFLPKGVGGLALGGLGAWAGMEVMNSDFLEQKRNDSGFTKWAKAAGDMGAGALGGAALGFSIGGPIGAAVGAVAGTVVGVIDSAKNWEGVDKPSDPRLPGYSSGAWRVTKNQMANLHQNEMVLPADVAESFRTAMQNHAATGGKSEARNVTIQVTLNDASLPEARRLVSIVKEELEMESRIDSLARA